MPDDIKCPKCGSTQISANKRGFSGGDALVGGLLTGGIGLLAGTIGSNKIKITCLRCGHEFKPGDTIGKQTGNPIVGIIAFIIVFSLILWMCN